MKITFPHIGNIYILVKVLFHKLKVDYVMPPPSSKRTIELGVRYAPEMVCLPLKINLGNFLESIEQGADTVIITGANGPCRFGYYGELHREILKGMGKDVRVVVLDDSSGIIPLATKLSEVFGTKNIYKVASAFLSAYRVISKVDNLDSLCHKVRARATDKRAVDEVMNKFKKDIDQTSYPKQIVKIITNTEKALKKVEQDKNKKPIKIGLVGDIYTLIEPISNIDIERQLGNLGVEVHKSLTISKWIKEHLLFSKNKKEFEDACNPYLKVAIGGHAKESIGNSKLYALNGYDGVIQLYPLTCMPEIVAASILPSVSKDMDIPILTLVIDEISGEAGYKTRMEAFVDVLESRRDNRVK